MIVARQALPHQSAIRIPQINANQSYIPDWKFLAGHGAAAAPLPRSCLLCRAALCILSARLIHFRVWLVQSFTPN
jgi:hypothetical protein